MTVTVSGFQPLLTSPSVRPWLSRSVLARLCIAAAALIAVTGLVGWPIARDGITAFGVQLLPLAPATALGLLGLCFSLLLRVQWRGNRSVLLARAVAILTLGWALLILVQATLGGDWTMERWQSAGRWVEGIPPRIMSPLAAVALILFSAAALALLASGETRLPMTDIAGCLGAGLGAWGFAVILGYVGGRPLMRQGWMLPVSLPAGLAFLALGVAIAAIAEPRLRFGRKRLPYALIPAVGVCLAFGLSALVERLEWNQVRLRLEHRLALWGNELERGISNSLDDLDDVGNLFSARGSVTREEFGKFVAGILERNPCLQALEWLPRVTDAQRKEFEESVQRQGFSAFEITEWNPTGEPVRSQRRSEYFPLCYVEPLATNQRAFGFDPSSESTRRLGLYRSRDTGEKTASGPIELVQAKGLGVIVTLPIYANNMAPASVADRRATLRGFISGVFRVSHLIEGSAKEVASEGIGLRVKDMTDSPDGRVLYVRGSVARTRPNSLQAVRQFDLAGRQWKIEWYPNRSYVQQEPLWRAWIVLFVGLTLASVLGAYVFGSAQHLVERERLIADLQKALAEVKTLKGFIPICASCKRIRDDRGFWNQIESYIQAHSDAQFSHGLCPECAKKYFPEAG